MCVCVGGGGGGGGIVNLSILFGSVVGCLAVIFSLREWVGWGGVGVESSLLAVTNEDVFKDPCHLYC